MLELNDIHTFYGPIEALKGITLKVNQGEIVCLIGNNGAGKSTTLMAISGILKPKAGTISFIGSDISDMPPHSIVERGISHVPEGRRIFPRLTVKENLEMGAYTVGSRTNKNKKLKSQFDKVYEMFPVLRERERQMGGTLSGGEQQMLAISRALMSEPKLLLLDEPSLGLAPIIVSRIFKAIQEINQEGVTILLVEQNAHAALNLSGRGYVLENGRIKMHGQGKELLNSEEVKKAYLGE
ncbi:MAG: ABC transporter ATP-binding protein [Nitrospirae bacterium RIFOXYB2_FULL_43_5]|nr:MAG: ABC transporter ATP-binding protein [Nitrospirae bacterium GWF2_44_13]OGW66083.1 MAG: ABC transporter ATP-binding protein [Nitrospirae bacterium RIFOXYA2_FULL_44_9]OGW73430.1 MAG: ABC transporter ATP-binding protein [Nitrospirae bacterium RIFOXYB2_FULL_43_5]HBG93472.1 ABC transporter ATP-binding protein [Nitrospiraceae bacterium]HBU05468.1 ABC transporter ATP-binding protein [Nitrospiraceae bacterium]